MSTKPTYEEMERKIKALETECLRLAQENETLKKSERLYFDLYENAPDMFVSVDAETATIISCNQALVDKLGYQKEEIVGRLIFDLYTPESATYAKQWVFPDFVQGGKVEGIELQLRRKDGGVLDVSLNISASHDEKGNTIYSRSIWRDITDRKRAEAALRESEERFRILFEQANDAIFVHDLAGRFHTVNSKALNSLGYTADELMNMKIWEVDPDFDARMENNDFWNTLPLTFEGRHLKRDGTTFPVEVRLTMITFREQRLVLAIVSDISERMKTRQQLQRSETLLNATQKQAKIGGWEYHTILKTMYWTDELYRIHGLDPDDFQPGSPGHIDASLRCYRPEDLSPILELFKKCEEKGVSYDFECAFNKASGEKIWIRAAASPVWENGKFDRVVGHIMDITDRKQAEEVHSAESERFQVFFNAVNDAIFIHPLMAEGFAPFVEVNSIACERYGYTRDEFLRLSAPDITGKSDAQVHSQVGHRRTLLETGHQVFEAIHVSKAGITIPVEINANIVYQQDRPFILAVVRDISERKQAEAALRHSEQLYRQVVNTMRDALVISDKNGKFQFINAAFCEIYQYSLKEALGLSAPQVIHPDYHHVFQRFVQDLEETGSFSGETVDARKDGSTFYTDIKGSKILFQGKECFLAVIHDITATKLAAQERDRLIAELQDALAKVRTLSGLLPICASCKKIRDDKGYWYQIESYISDHSRAEFSHSICPDCAKKLYPELDISQD